MLRNYIAIFSRNLKKQIGFSTINILGLALGLTCFSLITVFLSYESGFDQFHDGAERLFRINKTVTTSDGLKERHALTAGLLAPALEVAFPEVEATTRVQPWFDDVLISYNNEARVAPDVAIVDSNFFDVFGFRLLRGDSQRVLSAPLSIVLTESLAEGLFGDDDPVGQTVQALNNLEYVVTGVAADPNPRSHLRFSALISWSSTLQGSGGLEFTWMNRWITQAPFTYVRLSRSADPGDFERKLPAFYEATDPERAARYELYLQPIMETYLQSNDLLYSESTNRGSARSVRVFSILRFLILLIAAINFMNLSTARSSFRSKEVGIRKVLGAERSQVAWQFLIESVCYSLIAFVVALVLVGASGAVLAANSGLPAFQTNYPAIPSLVQGLIFAILLGVLAGLYPAAVLSRFLPVRQLNRSPKRRGSLMPRNVFVLVQFAISMMLVAGTMVVLRQLNFVQSRDAGFNPEQLLVLTTDDTSIQNQFAAFTAEVTRHPAILRAAGSNSVPGSATMTFGIRPDGVETEDNFIANIVRVDDFSLMETYEFELAAGRYFDENHPTDASSGIVVNEALLKSVGWDDAIGRRLDIPGELDEGEVIGVVRDFHFQSMHQTIAPLAFYYAPRGGNLTVRVSSASVSDAIEHLESTWKAFEPRYPFTYSFLDEGFARFYELEQRLLNLLGLFAVLALFIACLGLYGLAETITSNRTKEIGIRKVVGATIPQIVILFVVDLLRLVGLAILVGAPIVYLGAQTWLANFAYKAPIGMDVYILSGIIVLSVALLSVCYHPIRAGLINPVKSLRYE